MELRLLTRNEVVNNIPLLQLPLVRKGTPDQLTAYATANGYSWHKKPNLLFKGYFAHPNGDCLLPT